ncbi:NAD(P)-dependent oxidoreductase, partial [Escherichia coli]|nr:NAD(P)-dependent oxidoreductase [Escherichia coli]
MFILYFQREWSVTLCINKESIKMGKLTGKTALITGA